MWLNRILGALGRTFITLGVLLLLFAGFQLWGTGVEESQHQSELASSAAKDLDVKAGGDDDAIIGRITAELSRVDPETAPAMAVPPEGDWVGLIEIPKIGLRPRSIVSGVSKKDLRRGPGLYPGSPMPGQKGNVAIAGHRTTYGAPFNRIDELAPGDDIIVFTQQGRFTYRVEAPPEGKAIQRGPGWWTVRPKDTWVLDPSEENLITLTACHPKYSAAQRIIVRGRLVAEPAAAEAPATTTTTAAPATDHREVAAAEGPTASLEEGFAGDSDALVPALAYLGGFFGVWLLAWFVGRKWKRWPAYLLGTPVALVLLWFCFVHLDKFLPAI